jgi:tetrahydrodipicolinate N-succinyltransferase
MTVGKTLGKIRSNPGNAFGAAIAIGRGFLVRVRFLGSPNVSIGPGFRADAFPYIRGPGRVVIGANVSMRRGFLRRPCILTHSRDAVVTIGSRSVLGGTRISCVNSVRIGDDALFASCTIIDADVIPSDNVTMDSGWVEAHAKPVVIGNRVWAGINSFILAGAAIGDECVIGAGAVVLDQPAPARSVLAGNPARRIGETRQS